MVQTSAEDNRGKAVTPTPVWVHLPAKGCVICLQKNLTVVEEDTEVGVTALLLSGHFTAPYSLFPLLNPCFLLMSSHLSIL